MAPRTAGQPSKPIKTSTLNGDAELPRLSPSRVGLSRRAKPQHFEMTVVYDATKGRSVVARATGAPPLLFKVRGSIRNGTLNKNMSEDFELKVMNSAGALQPAASFHQFMRVVLTDVVEAYKVKDRELRQEAEDEWDSDEDDAYAALRRAHPDDVWDNFDTIDDFKQDVMLSVLPRLNVPWPLEGMFEGLNTRILDKLLKEVAPRRREAVMLRLVALKTPKLAGISHLLEEFIPMIGVVPTRNSLILFLGNLRRGYRDYSECLDPGPFDVDEYRTSLLSNGHATGQLLYYASTVRWSCAPPDGPHVDSSDDESSYYY